MKHKNILPMLEPPLSSPSSRRMFAADLLADEELKAERQVVCDHCIYNLGGICKQCCGGVPIEILKRLRISRCARGLWKR